jgi:hypothetical protein
MRTTSPDFSPSDARTRALTGRKYRPDLLSGKADVFQLVRPTIAVMRTEPHALRTTPRAARICAETLPDRV